MDEIKQLFAQITDKKNFDHVSTFYKEFEFIKYIFYYYLNSKWGWKITKACLGHAL